ncbi:DUF4861 domain-containing protein [Parabacteroides sp. 52]|uniref:DUF4861 domain-containing protein n=1 Tax=unclassified Parabacteroides TaxID=2649774 RepID=UPI0013D65BC3|nr:MULTISPECIES: DUF4861 domain-containing protein [unclassified Parabacteroides]MDH6534017.1 hypothetical protein [Parabacteroides sp. PM5-20]NDV54758.1 DUF4861 domain-containing protein [Parabacteroides sp. 52]
MKKILGLFFLAAAFACTESKNVEITVNNPLEMNRENEVVELSPDALSSIQAKYGDQFLITDAKGTEIAYQLTYDNKLIFPVSVGAKSSTVYTVVSGTPKAYSTISCGKFYPERVDDIAWENDRVAFRTYGPALQATGERAFGYDIWTKSVSHPVVEARYHKELNPETRAKIAELRKTDPKAARELANSVSYHFDHGDGLDYYSVGPTLGGGTSALMTDDSIVYPYCYKTYEILDNGPLRFTVKLVYNPLTVKENDNVIETRLLSLDAGTQLNKVVLNYENLTETTPIATGIVIHEPSDVYQADATKGYIAYADPIHPENGQIYAGAVVPQIQTLKEAKAVYFSEEEKKDRKANGHVLAISDYTPGNAYTYYFGGGWSKWGFATPEDWFVYMQTAAEKINNPLTVTIQ